MTGFRGETKELWQMEGRVQRDIWYIEHWTFILDLYNEYRIMQVDARRAVNSVAGGRGAVREVLVRNYDL